MAAITQLDLSACTCDMTSDVILNIHQEFSGLDLCGQPVTEVFASIWRNIFFVVVEGVRTLDSQKLLKVDPNSEKRAKGKGHSPYLALAHYLKDDPQSLMKACCSWYMQTGVAWTIDVILLLPNDFPTIIQQMVTATDSEFFPFVLDRVFTLVEGVIRNKAVTEDITRESVDLSQLFIFANGTPASSTEVFFGGNVEFVYERLHDLSKLVEGINGPGPLAEYRGQRLHTTSTALCVIERNFRHVEGISTARCSLSSCVSR